MNKTAAKNWLVKAWHHLGSAQILNKANHYTDTIAIEIHYSIEICLKSFSVAKNEKVRKTHDLVELFDNIVEDFNLDEAEIRKLAVATDYHITEAYPVADKLLPDRAEINDMLSFA